MESNKAKLGVIIALVLIIIGVGAAVYVLTRDTDEGSNTTTKPEPATAVEEAIDETADQTQLPTIVFTDDGFAQNEYRFATGTAIRVENRSSMDMQFSSDDHPAHRNSPELNMKLLGAGESDTFTPPGRGKYGFHDHINDQFEGTLIIE